MPRLAALLALILLIALTAAPAAASIPTPKTQSLRFERLGVAEGLSQDEVLAILQDRQGYLWFGTQDGLNRYNGYTFTVFRHDSKNKDSLSNSSILSLAEDEAGNLWVGTRGGGLNRYDAATGKFTAFRHDPADPASLSNDTVTDLQLTRDGVLWVATLGGLNRSNPDGTFTLYQPDPADPNSLSADNVSALYEDAAGNLWIGTGFDVAGRGLNRFDPRTDSFTRYVSDPANPDSLSSNNIAAIFEDAHGALWIGTGGFNLSGAGLNRLNADGTFTRFQHDSADPGSLGHDNVISLWQNEAGELWIGTEGGLNLFNPNYEPAFFRHIAHDPFDPQSLSNNVIRQIYADRSGVLWLGAAPGGINKFSPRLAQFGLYQNRPNDSTSLGFNAVGRFYEDSRGAFWVATWGKGLDYFDRTSDTFIHYRYDPLNPKSLVSNQVTAIFEDSRDVFWIGTLNGVAWFDRLTSAFTPLLHDSRDPSSLISNSVNQIVEDNAGQIWIATLEGLDRYERLTGRFVHYLNEPGDSNSLSANSVTALYKDGEGRLWVGTRGGGLNRFDAAAGKFVRYQYNPADLRSLSDNSVQTIWQDQEGRLWVGTQGGLNRLNADGAFERYGLEDGLPDERVQCILDDGAGNLWFSTGNGLARLNLETETFKAFDASDGLQGSEFNAGACYRDVWGRMYFGGPNGFNVFDPRQIQDNPQPPPIVVTAFDVFNQPLPTDLSGATPIESPDWQKFIAFEFAALDYHAPQKNRYAYKLEGFDADWVQAGARRTVSYPNLPAGRYLFRVKAANSDGVWNETGVAIPLIITLPIWQNGWFQGGAGLLIVAGLATAYTLRLRSIHAQKRELEAQVAQRTDDLRREIEQRKQAEAALAHKAAEEAVIAERTRLARDLHDAVTQTLFSASLIAEVLPDLWQTDEREARQSADELRQLTRGALAEMRTLLLELRPAALTQTCLADLLKQLTDALIGRSRLPITLQIDGERWLPPEVQVAFYRIAQESLNNIVKYARATRAEVCLAQTASQTRLEISDNGVGFEPAAIKPTSLGLCIMRERAEAVGAELRLTSAPGQGTRVSVIWYEI